MVPARYGFTAFLGLSIVMPVHAMEVNHASIVDVESAYAFETGSWQKQEIVWRPEWVVRFASGSRLTLIGEGRLDAKDELDPGRPDQPFRARYNKKGFPMIIWILN